MSDGREIVLSWLIEKSKEWNDWKKLKVQEQSLLQEIANLSSIEYAEQISNELDSKKHFYTFKTYLELLELLTELLQNNINRGNIKRILEIEYYNKLRTYQ